MIKDNQTLFNRIHLLVDALITAVSYMLAWYWKFEGPFAKEDPSIGVLSRERYFSFLIYVVPLYIVLYYFFNMYKPKRTLGRRYEIFNILKANTVGVLLLIVLLYMIS